jgi:uncharacterized protein
MDVTLVLTHRCNLSCHYCYAGDHVKKDMDDATMARALDLLYSDGARSAKLGFFGGEPTIAWDAMTRAIAGAEARAARRGRGLVAQCTTNGTLIGAAEAAWVAAHRVHVTVSIDGVREAHEASRPQAGGGSSFDQTVRGLCALRDAGASFDVLLVITPATVEHLSRSVTWLWDERILRVRANLELRTTWLDGDRQLLERELDAVGDEMIRRRRAGEQVVFDPFLPALRAASPGSLLAAVPAQARRVVVGTSGHIYPCAPMVGEDRDGGPEAALRIAHLDDGATAIAQAADRLGAACGTGGPCSCAAVLETGSRFTTGPVARWYHEAAWRAGTRVAAASSPAAGDEPPKLLREVEPGVRRRTAIRRLVVLGVGGLAVASGVGAAALMDRPAPAPAPKPPAVTPPPVTSQPPTIAPTVEGAMPIPEPPKPGEMPVPVEQPRALPPKPEPPKPAPKIPDELQIDGDIL